MSARRRPGPVMSAQSRPGPVVNTRLVVTEQRGIERPVAIALEDVSKVHGRGKEGVLALDRIGLTIRRGEFVCVVGASGCGKSTLLHLIAGLDEPTSGAIGVSGVASDGATAGGATAIMFQDAALFPWLSVEQNVEFPLTVRGVPAAARRERVKELLELVHLEPFARRQPHELSGGMRQRVALARALAHATNVLLMDEPFAALDAMMRDSLHHELERIVQATGLTVLFVTHNVREAVRLGDRVLLFSSRPGRLLAEHHVPLDRPRRLDSPEIAALAAVITDQLRNTQHVLDRATGSLAPAVVSYMDVHG
jgi:NitT/TauT family transport system ATP-binding protein